MNVATTQKLTLNPDAIWEEVEKVQATSRQRKIERHQVDLFVHMCRQALKTCEKYGIETSAIEVEVTGGGVPISYKYVAETTIISYLPELKLDDQESHQYLPTGVMIVTVQRGPAKKNRDNHHARIRVPAHHPARNLLKEAGLITGNDRYARVYRG